MEQGATMPTRYSGKLYPYLPHSRVDGFKVKYGMTYDVSHFNMCINLACAIFLLGLVSFASCWHVLSFVSIFHLVAILAPYAGSIAHPKAYFLYNALAFLLTFISFCGGCASGCWAVPVFVEIPILILTIMLMLKLAKVDPDIGRRCSRNATPNVTTHQTPTLTGMGAEPPRLTLTSGTSIQEAGSSIQPPVSSMPPAGNAA
jgi:hypothetical protein